MRLGLVVTIQACLSNGAFSWSKEGCREWERWKKEKNHECHDHCRYSFNLIRILSIKEGEEEAKTDDLLGREIASLDNMELDHGMILIRKKIPVKKSCFSSDKSKSNKTLQIPLRVRGRKDEDN